MKKKKVILVLAPHTDDGELGCGATISKYAEEEHDIFYVAFSACEDSLPEEYEKDTLRKEAKKATSMLGIPNKNTFILKYPVRRFTQYRQEILEDLMMIKNRLNPSIVFLPSSQDVHQDHIVINQEGIRAFKDTNILGYELPWNNLSNHHHCFQPLKERHVAQKSSALTYYESQKDRPYMNKDFIFALAKTRGVQIKSEYAECFEVIRWIL